MKGVRLCMAPWRRPHPDTAPTASKATGLYMIGTMSKHAAMDQGYDDALMLDWKGDVAESTGANIFFNMGGELHTPTPVNFLDGITRRTVIDLAKRRGIEVVERRIMPEELTGFEECFICGTGAEVTPVSEAGPYRFTPAAISRQMVEDYAAEVMRMVRSRFGEEVHVMAEPGRGLVAEAGVIVAEVLLVAHKDQDDLVRWVYLDIGKFSGLAETIDEAIRYQFETRHGDSPTGACILAGPSCDSADVLYEKRPVQLPLELAAGDKVRILCTGAYTTSYSSVGFNGFPPLDAVFIG